MRFTRIHRTLPPLQRGSNSVVTRGGWLAVANCCIAAQAQPCYLYVVPSAPRPSGRLISFCAYFSKKKYHRSASETHSIMLG